MAGETVGTHTRGASKHSPVTKGGIVRLHTGMAGTGLMGGGGRVT